MTANGANMPHCGVRRRQFDSMETYNCMELKNGYPLVSVIMPVYNEQRYLSRTVESILLQTFDNFEFIIINDGSNDRTSEILEKYRKGDNRVIILDNLTNMGCGWSTNRGIQASRGKYIAIIDAGDIAMADRLEKQVDFLEKNYSIYILGSYAYTINDDLQIIGMIKRDTDPLKIRKKAFRYCHAIHTTVMYRGELFDKIGLYDDRLKHARDFELLIRALKAELLISNIPEFLMYNIEKDTGMTYSNVKRVMINEFDIRLNNYCYFVNSWNTIYLFLVFIFCLLPEPVLRYHMKLCSRGFWNTCQCMCV